LKHANKIALRANTDLAFQKYALDQHAIVSVTDLAGNILYANDKLCILSGYAQEEMIGKNENILKSDEHSDKFFKNMWEVISKGHTWSGDIKNTDKTGMNFWVETTIVPILKEKCKPFQYIAISTDITERVKTEEKLKYIAHYDLLTHLPNRVLLADRLNQAMLRCQRRNKFIAVAFLDLDGFKSVNDTHGHTRGDELLVELSTRMNKALREGDTLARIGGDEFIAIMVDLEKTTEKRPLLQRLLKAASSTVTLGDYVINLSASIGVTLYPQDDVEAEQLTRHADQAMYIAKQAGKNRYHLFDTEHDNAIEVKQEKLNSITSALSNKEFVLHYQPKVNMQTGDIIGVEALIRWQHPNQGLIPPLYFLPSIKGHSISLEVGEWVINAALSQISRWQSMGINLPISINISAYQLQQDNFTVRLEAMLAGYPKVSPHLLELEVLETSELINISQVYETMNDCLDLGVSFALDDFGAGFSSLSHLRHLPAYLIKIDQGFVSNMLLDKDDFAIVKGVISLAETFGREVIAEGVETLAHKEALLNLGCQKAQGYGIARPMPHSDIGEWISSWKSNNALLA
jgi:diguanylate cyclase (GGDEF)-like protein/PAS domain S-box-containing protein